MPWPWSTPTPSSPPRGYSPSRRPSTPIRRWARPARRSCSPSPVRLDRAVINNVGNELSTTLEPRDRGYGEVDRGQFDVEEDVWAWCGACALLGRRYLDEVGLLDERLFMYAEDIDLSWRGARKGWRYRYVPGAVVRHLHRASSGGERTPLLDHLNRRNRLVVVTRHGGPSMALHAWARAVGGIVVAVGTDVLGPLIRARKPQLGSLRRRVRAAVDALRLVVGGNPPLP